jgi:hypothetical protein
MDPNVDCDSEQEALDSATATAFGHAGRARRTSSLPMCGVGVARRCSGPLGIGRACRRAHRGYSPPGWKPMSVCRNPRTACRNRELCLREIASPNALKATN